MPIWLRNLTLRLLVRDNSPKEDVKEEESTKFLDEFKEKNKMGVPDYVMNVKRKHQ